MDESWLGVPQFWGCYMAARLVVPSHWCFDVLSMTVEGA
ncbi:hypothetical protein MIZ03_1004 [Rhodoferax lithotrophicus]|uniref:Transposase n=1 Tax=Rhodoferax lithotrophicus TaxID=2798804 RepID=A0ABN6D2H4_9BURK|nr:hypothetical protein MIZ03_1004 [Rhodoferax sp. MIZ03]